MRQEIIEAIADTAGTSAAYSGFTWRRLSEAGLLLPAEHEGAALRNASLMLLAALAGPRASHAARTVREVAVWERRADSTAAEAAPECLHDIATQPTLHAALVWAIWRAPEIAAWASWLERECLLPVHGKPVKVGPPLLRVSLTRGAGARFLMIAPAGGASWVLLDASFGPPAGQENARVPDLSIEASVGMRTLLALNKIGGRGSQIRPVVAAAVRAAESDETAPRAAESSRPPEFSRK